MPEAQPADLPEGLRQRRRDPDAAEQPENQQPEEAPAPAAAPEPDENAFSANLLWTFLTSFFSSLIPERPQAAA